MNKKGFTLIELLVVISIIGLLASLVLVSFSGAQKQARDTQRKSDIKQYQTALEQYANKNNGLYISTGGAAVIPANSSYCSALGMTNCPDDPKIPSQHYGFESDGTPALSTTATNYVLWTQLENTLVYWVVCSNGKVGTIVWTSWSAPANGSCPI